MNEQERKEKKIYCLIQSIAPPSFLENDDSVDYLSNFLANPESSLAEADLLSYIREFFGEEYECEAKELSRAIRELSLETETATNEIETRTDPFSLGAPQSNIHNENINGITNIGEEVSNQYDNENETTKTSSPAPSKASKKSDGKDKGLKKGEEKKDNIKAIQALAAAELEELDDYSTAWAECVAEGRTWGGKGFGGRGLRSVYTSTSGTSVHLQNVSLQFAGNDLLQNATIQITEKKRYGLIGRNGVGKSVLLRRLASKSIPGFPIQMKVLFVRQEVEGSSTLSALQFLLDSDEDRMMLLKEQSKLEELLESSDPKVVAQAASELGELTSELELNDNTEDRARDILKGLQFSEEMILSPTVHLSGGWKMRLALAQVLFVRSDLLLLDEVTNHLDLHAVFWLADYLCKSDRTILLVSHDRAFLDAVCTDIIHFSNKKLMYYPGNYTAFEQHQMEKAAREAQILDATERKRSKALEFVERHQHASSKKHGYDPNKQRQAKTIRDKKLDRLGNYREDGKRYKNFSLKKLSEDYLRTSQQVEVEPLEAVVRFKLPNPVFPTSLKEDDSLVTFDEVSFAYNKNSRLIIKDASLQIRRKSKIAVVGRNGSGKSTVLKLIIGEVKNEEKESVMNGILWRHPTLRLGHVAQHDVEALVLEHGNESPVEYLGEKLKEHPDSAAMAGTTGSIRQYLGAYGLGGKHANRVIASLSGGERMRLCFAATFAMRPHLLLLDEPTNHVDMETLDALASALDAFEGAVIIVSHNQRFLCGFCNELWVVENGQVEVRHGDEFEEIFAIFKSETLSEAQGRSSVRNIKSAMAKQATKQRTTPKTGGFIG